MVNQAYLSVIDDPDGPSGRGAAGPPFDSRGVFRVYGVSVDDEAVSTWDDASDEEGRAPICPYCGVTTLPAELSHVLDTDFVCDNADCEAYGERIDP